MLTFLVRAQALPIVEKDGQKFYQYVLPEGQSLTQLQTLFKCDADQLLALNPGLERGLVAGQTILVPVLRGPIVHKVTPQQTLFAVSRLYEVPVDSLYSWNPSARLGLKVGQQLVLKNMVLPFQVNGANPAPIVTSSDTFAHKLTDSIIKHTVLEKENLYAISKRYMVPVDSLMALNKLTSSRVSPGQQILVPIQKVKTTSVPVQAVPAPAPKATTSAFRFPVAPKAHYNIAVFLPFALDSAAGQNRFVAAAALDYYMGMKMALDSLKNLGFSADIRVFDDNALSPSLEAVLRSSDMNGIDLIFSPLQEKQAKIVATYAKEKGIPVVFPVQMSVPLAQMASNFMAYTPSDAALVENLALQLHQKYQGYTVVLINSPLAADQLLEQKFKTAFASVPTTKSKLKLQEASWTTYQKYKPIGGPQLLVSFSSERAKVVGLLKASALDSNVMVVGQKDWLDFKELDAPQVRDQAFLVALPSYFNYHDTQIIPFHKAYRKRYNADLSKMACLGYDLTLHIGKQLLGNAAPQQGLISNMNLRNSANGLFIENNAAVVVPYRNAQLLVPHHE
ncbi:MAG: LysM peptidoglycan-binding domain-containing protein [Crocinitomicaceae bacterium]|nr:LysM peptidoglycan-binding domain-containing protein [Crocinitomicaceae bacterium]MDP4868713.1 LysM peptidoglycan-binding domain-containing protein [Crocinitomicaceae bacterium]MDP5066809.1 LysM peptidoglycan-binding domain-containing protein [Crocinitomicaceae bacterium]